jgi:hypothetical protein
VISLHFGKNSAMSSLLPDIESRSHGRLRPVSMPVVTDRSGNALKRAERKLGKELIAAKFWHYSPFKTIVSSGRGVK